VDTSHSADELVSDMSEKRTTAQNNAIHLYCELLAEALNNAGYEMKEVFKVMEVDIPWNKDRVKDLIWKKIQAPMTEKFSTTELNTKEVGEVYKVVDRAISSNFGVHVEFPSYDHE